MSGEANWNMRGPEGPISGLSGLATTQLKRPLPRKEVALLLDLSIFVESEILYFT